MKKILLIYTLIIILMSFYQISANFVCSSVESAKNISSDWMNVITYYEENPSEISNCKINPEKKFCCDLEEIKSISFAPGKKVFAEVFDNSTGYISNLVSLETSSNGYDLFPKMQIFQAIKINPKIKKILINQTLLKLNISIRGNYNNLKYKLNGNEYSICNNCNYSHTNINLSKGKNNLEIIAYNNFREISKKFEIYSLDYLNIEEKIDCKKCRNNKIPANSLVNLSILINASHNISVELKEYYPNKWIYFGEDQEFGENYNLISRKIQGKNIKEIFEFKSPWSFFPKKYTFKTDIEGINKELELKVYWLFPWFFLKQNFNLINFSYYSYSSPKEPMIIKPFSEILSFIAIYPTDKEFIEAKVYKKYNWIKREWEFKILTNIPKNKINEILIQIKTKKNSKWILKDLDKEINLSLVKTDKEYNYYRASLKSNVFYLKKKGLF